MAIKTLTALVVFAVAASASSIPRPAPRDTAKTFRLSATVLARDLSPSVQGLELSFTPVDGCLSDLFFVPAGSGVAFSTDGGKIGLPHYSTYHNVFADFLITPGGTATVPSGHPVQLQCQNGTADVAELVFTTGAWMACPGDDGVYLANRQEGQRSLAVCADIQLVAKCDASQNTIDGVVDISCQS